jgi:hypothetical protein
MSGVALFWEKLRKAPLSAAGSLAVEYAMFETAAALALSIYLTRKPLAFVERVSGVRVRERFVDFVARLSPG